MLRARLDRYNMLHIILCVISIVLIFRDGFTQAPLDKSDKENKDYLTGFIYDAKNKRDPFIPLVTSDGRLLKLEQEETPELSLEGIIYDKSGLSYAIINGEVRKIGDIVNGYQVLKIEENKVILIKEGQLSEVELNKKEGSP